MDWINKHHSSICRKTTWMALGSIWYTALWWRLLTYLVERGAHTAVQIKRCDQPCWHILFLHQLCDQAWYLHALPWLAVLSCDWPFRLSSTYHSSACLQVAHFFVPLLDSPGRVYWWMLPRGYCSSHKRMVMGRGPPPTFSHHHKEWVRAYR